MREVRIDTLCDECFIDSGVRTPATATFTVAAVQAEMTGPPVKLLELCEPHSKRITELMALLAEVGQLPEAKPPAQPPARKTSGPARLKENPEIGCPICGKRIRRLTLVRHLWSLHLDGWANKPAQPAECPECGTSFEVVNMGMHRAAAHGWSPVQEALDIYNARKR